MVRTIKYGIVHAFAQCKECKWTDGINISESNRMQKLRSRIYSHVNKTGHTVSLEKGGSTDYIKID